MKNKVLLVLLAVVMMISLTVSPVQAAGNEISSEFVSLTDEYKINYLMKKGIISGFSDNTFRPYNLVTRGQFASFIARALDLPMPKNPKRFKDVGPKTATYEGIAKAHQAGIISGYSNGTFLPNQEISRAQMAIMLDKALQSKGSYPKKSALTYADRTSIGKSSYEAVQRVTHYRIMEGFNKGSHFQPNYPVDRVLTVASIYSLLEETGLLDETAMKKVKVPKGWTKEITKEHDKKIAATVLKYSPKIGTGHSFGKGGITRWTFDDPTYLPMVEKRIAMYGSTTTLADWLEAIDYAIETGDVYIAPDNSYGLYAIYVNDDYVIMEVR